MNSWQTEKEGGQQGKETLRLYNRVSGTMTGGNKEVKLMHPEHRRDSLSMFVLTAVKTSVETFPSAMETTVFTRLL